MVASPTLTSSQRHAAAALLAIALRQAQINQSLPLPLASDEDASDDISSLWNHESRCLLRPIFRYLEINESAWTKLGEAVASKDGVEDYLRIILKKDTEESVERSEQKLALRNAVNAMIMSWETVSASNGPTEDGDQKYEHECQEKGNVHQSNEVSQKLSETSESNGLFKIKESINRLKMTFTEKSPNYFNSLSDEKTMLRVSVDNNQENIAVLYELLSACVADAPEDNNKAFHQRRGYDARHRVALRLLAAWLDVKWIKMEAMEIMVACSAMAAAKEEAHSHESESEKNNWSEWKRGGIIGAAALTGGTLLAITGGLAAPAIAAGFGALSPTLGTLIPVIGASGFSAVASAAGSVAGSAAVAASFGAAGAGLSGSKMARRIASIEEFEFKPVGENHNQGVSYSPFTIWSIPISYSFECQKCITVHLAVEILVSGFVFEEEDFIRPWEGMEDNLERYALQWESEHLIAVSTAIQDWITSRLTRELIKQGAMMTVLGTLVSALAWPAALLSATDFIDSKWSMAIDRSDKAGKLLAETLLKGLQGNRPVTLLGFSLGARVIFKCLQHLAESGDNEGLIEKVVLLGAPISLNGEEWEAARKMVAGRFVNVYSANDWILGVTFRASLLTQGLAGIQAVNVPGVENVDVTDLIEGHSSYLWAVGEILAQLDLDSHCPVFTSPILESEKQKSEV